LIATSRTSKAWPRPADRWFHDQGHSHFVAAKPAGAEMHQPEVAWVGLGLVALMVLTTGAVAWVSVWWVPPYLSLMVLIFITPKKPRQPVLPRKPGELSANVIASDLTNSVGVDRTGDGERILFAADLDSVRLARESIVESADDSTDSTSSGKTKLRRSRSRARKVAKTAIEPLPEFAPATWIRVGPGKFVRKDAHFHDVDQANTEDASADPNPVTDRSTEVIPALTAPAVMQQERHFFDPWEVTPANEGIVTAFDDVGRQLVTQEYGITPSAFGPIPPDATLVEGPEDARSGVSAEPGADSDPLVDLDVKASRRARGLEYCGSRERTSSDRVSRVSQGLVSAMHIEGCASLRRDVRNSPRTRTLVRSSFVPNTRFWQAARRAFGRLPHIHRALRPRSPPVCARPASTASFASRNLA
jgi:hypothetical protein